MYPTSTDKKQPVSSFHHLKYITRALENYYHPSNSGHWSQNLSFFLNSLANAFSEKLAVEAHPDCKIADNLRITKEMTVEFVKLLTGICFLSMFSKQQTSVGLSHSTLKCLAWIEPDLAFPELLERVYGGLETLTEV